MNEFDGFWHGSGQKMSISLQSQAPVPSCKDACGIHHFAAGSIPRYMAPACMEHSSV